jgi:hypothetical protein
MVKQRLKIREVAADGQCLFNSVAFLMIHYNNNNTKNYKQVAAKLRKAVCDKLSKQVDKEKKLVFNMRSIIHTLSASLDDIHDKPNMEANNENSITKRAEKYIRLMRRKATWGGMLEVNKLHEIAQEQGFKGIKIYRLKREKLKNNKVSGMVHVGRLYQIRSGMDNPMNNRKTKPALDIILHNAEQGGNHYDPLLQVTRKVGK